MQEEFSQYLATLLFQHDQLSIPGLGSFELSHEPALIDQIQGQLSPPSKAVAFNPNLVLDDGLLVEYISAERQLSTTDAKAWIARQVEEIKDKLSQRQIVELPGVGRFFRNIKQELQFVADKENYNPDSYGLAAVRANPVVRHAAAGVPAPPTPAVKPENKRATTTFTKPGVSNSISGWFQRFLPWIILLSILLVGFALYFLFLRPSPVEEDPTADIPTERLNASPSRAEEEAELPSTDPATAEDEPSTNEQEPDTEAPTIGPNEHSAVIAVGLFRNQQYVERLVEKLYSAGFEAYTARENDLTRVGVMVRYEREDELEKSLREVQTEFESSAFVMIKDGERIARE